MSILFCGQEVSVYWKSCGYQYNTKKSYSGIDEGSLATMLWRGMQWLNVKIFFEVIQIYYKNCRHLRKYISHDCWCFDANIWWIIPYFKVYLKYRTNWFCELLKKSSGANSERSTENIVDIAPSLFNESWGFQAFYRLCVFKNKCEFAIAILQFDWNKKWTLQIILNEKTYQLVV